MDTSRLLTDGIYYLCTWRDLKCVVPAIQTLQYKYERPSPSGNYTQYIFVDPNDAYQVDIRTYLAKVGRPVEDLPPPPRGEITMDVAGVGELVDLNGLIVWLSDLRMRLADIPRGRE